MSQAHFLGMQSCTILHCLYKSLLTLQSATGTALQVGVVLQFCSPDCLQHLQQKPRCLARLVCHPVLDCLEHCHLRLDNLCGGHST